MSAVPGADDWGAVAGEWRTGLVDAADDGAAQVAGEGRPVLRALTRIRLTRALRRVGVLVARLLFIKGINRPSTRP